MVNGCALNQAGEREDKEFFDLRRPRRGASTYLQLRPISLVVDTTHMLFGTQVAAYATRKVTLTHMVITVLRLGMLYLADRDLFGFARDNQQSHGKANLLWWVKKILRLEAERLLPHGLYLGRGSGSKRD